MQNKLKIGIIGTGSRGVDCFGQILKKRSDVEIAALCDTNSVRCRTAAELLNITPNLYCSVDEMTAVEKLDAVIITVIDSEHYICAKKALLAGWHVLLDKPLATQAADGKELIALAKETGKTLMIGFNLRHHPVLMRLKELIDNGTLGRIFIAENREFYDGGRTYFSRWNRFFENTGGLWIHKASHDFDIFNWLLGFPKPLRVSSFAAMNVFDKNHLPFELEAGKTPGPDCNSCYYQNKCKDKWVLSENALKLWSPEAVAEVSLTDRTITITPRWGTEVVTYKVPHAEGEHGGADPNLVESFCKVIRGELTVNSTAEHGLLATALGQAAEMSRRQQRMVEMSEIL